MRIPKRLKGCNGCIYFNVTHAACDYAEITGKSRIAQKATLLPGGGCRLKENGDKLVVTTMFSGKTENRYRVVMPDGKIRYLKEEDYQTYKEEQS